MRSPDAGKDVSLPFCLPSPFASFRLTETDASFPLCNIEYETLHHLFFAWSYTTSDWQLVSHLCDIRRHPLPWPNDIQWMNGKFRSKKVC